MFADQGGETGSRKGSDVTTSDTEVVVPKAPESVSAVVNPQWADRGRAQDIFAGNTLW